MAKSFGVPMATHTTMFSQLASQISFLNLPNFDGRGVEECRIFDVGSLEKVLKCVDFPTNLVTTDVFSKVLGKAHHSLLISCASDTPSESAKVSSERKHGSFLPSSTSEMKVRLRPE